MSEIEHTPGPWEAKGVVVWAAPVQLIGGGTYHRPISDCRVEGMVKGHENNEANARLIAAAPDLLEACASVWLLLADTGDNKLRLIADECRAAIAKAEGR